MEIDEEWQGDGGKGFQEGEGLVGEVDVGVADSGDGGLVHDFSAQAFNFLGEDAGEGFGAGGRIVEGFIGQGIFDDAVG